MTDGADRLLEISGELAILHTWWEAVRAGVQQVTPQGMEFYAKGLDDIRKQLEELSVDVRRRETDMLRYSRKATEALLQARAVLGSDHFPIPPMPLDDLPPGVVRFPGKLARDIYWQGRRSEAHHD